MPNIVISDTSCLILFQKINHLEILLKVYQTVITTPQIAAEFNETLPSWIKIVSVKDQKYLDFLSTQVDIGEASAIALAKELDDPLVILDEQKGRRLAKKLGLKVTGSLGVIHKAKELGVIAAIKPILDKIAETNFRISDKILAELLLLNNES
jgi:predicted nucleic acid-binding protein